MSEQHTPGPLAARKTMVLFSGKAGGFDIRNCPDAEANARRLVACWNACEGLHTESLECGKPLADQLVEALNQRDELRDENKQLKATQYGSGRLQELRDQRDELLALLRIVRGKHGCGALTLPSADVERIDAAIAKAGGAA